MEITPKQWESVKVLFEAAFERSPAEQQLLVKRCPEEAVRHEVARLLLDYRQAGSFLTNPPTAVTATLATELHIPRFATGVILARRFRVVRFIARGGMGEVYEAEDLEMRESVAIKTVRPDVLHDPNALQRFNREVRLARKVTHPNVCRIFDLFRHETEGPNGPQEVMLVSMELLQGETLAQRLGRDGKISIGEALPLIEQMVAGLEAAHEAGVVHRDFKPGNIVLVPTALGLRGVVTDFGLAIGSASEVSHGESLTQSLGSGTHGTPAYMSPEQVMADKLDARTDVFSFGVVLYEMLMGTMAFRGDTTAEMFHAILRQTPVSPAQLDSTIPPQLEHIIVRCLEKDRKLRYQTAAEIHADLKSFKLDTRSAPSTLTVRDGAPWSTHTLAVFVSNGRFWKFIIPVATLLLAGLVTILAVSRQAPALTEKDSVVLADFANSTGDAVFDDTLKQALAADLDQSPLLKILPEARVRETLTLMVRSPQELVVGGTALEVCQRTGSKAVLAGSIAKLGSQYVVGLEATNCRTGESLGREQAQAATKEQVLKALDSASSKLRRRLGESLSTVQRFDAPFEQVTTGSLEALRAYSLGLKALNDVGSGQAIAFFQQATELDPDFAVAYDSLAGCYDNEGEWALSRQGYQKAYELRNRVSVRERYRITASYEAASVGNLLEAASISKSWAETYPQDPSPHHLLGAIYLWLGDYEKSLAETTEELRLDPESSSTYQHLFITQLAQNRVADAKAADQQVIAHHGDGPIERYVRYQTAFLEGDFAAMQENLDWALGKPDAEDLFLTTQSDTEAYFGRLDKASGFSRRALRSATANGRKVPAASSQLRAALHEAEFGNRRSARQAITSALAISSAPEIKTLAVLASARAGDFQQAEVLADQVTRELPEDTLLHNFWLPTARATIEVNRGRPARAIELLQDAGPYDFGGAYTAFSVATMYSTYVRGEAYMQLHQGREAAIQFQKIIDHPGVILNFPLAALARVQLGRAKAMSGDLDEARNSYKEFFTVWKDADPDIPILRAAKAEYVRLQSPATH